MKNNKLLFVFYIAIAFVLVALMLIYPKSAIASAEKGLIMCGKIIVPSLFPINFCVIFIMKVLNQTNIKNKKLLIFVFSLIGGYPTGPKLLNEEYKSSNIDLYSARVMQLFCVNGGIGFIISAIGIGIFGSQKLGVLLFLSHSLSSLILFLILKKRITMQTNTDNKPRNENLADIFVLSASESSNTVLSICSFVILLSVVNGFLLKYKYLKYLCFITEITSALTLTKNIYFVAFLLSFGGISIWCQVISVSKDIGINLKAFLFSRVFCGAVSSAIIFMLLKIFNVSINVFSNNMRYKTSTTINGVSVSVSLAIMIILLIISLEGKKIGGNLRDDLLK